MNATAALPVVGVDLSKSVFQLAIADTRGLPKSITVDNGPEFDGQVLDKWAFAAASICRSHVLVSLPTTRISKHSTVGYGRSV